jgi:hypothetical protein
MIAASIPGGPGAEQAPQKLTVAPEGVNFLQPNQRPLPYQGDSKYGSLVNEYFNSNFYKPTNHMGMAMFEDPLFGHYSSQSGAGVYGQGFMDYLQNAQKGVMTEMTNRRVKSPEEMQRYGLIGEAYNKMFPGGNAFYEANQMQLPKPPGASGGIQSGILGMLPADPKPIRPLPVEGPLDPATGLPITGSNGPSIMDPGGSGTAELITEQIDPNIFASLNSGEIITSPDQVIHSQSPSQQPAFFPGSDPFFGKPYSEDMSGGINAVADPITNNFMPLTPQQPTGGFDSKAFANELLTGIGDLFKQHFPDSAQMAFNNSNQQQSQIEQPIQDATTFDVQPQQNMAFNPFSVNTLGGSFGGGY